jgi:hypothetical protein
MQDAQDLETVPHCGASCGPRSDVTQAVWKTRRARGLAVRWSQAPEGTPGPADCRVLQRFERLVPQRVRTPTAREGNMAAGFRAAAVERHLIDFGPAMLRRGLQDIDRLYPFLEDCVLDQPLQ